MEQNRISRNVIARRRATPAPIFALLLTLGLAALIGTPGPAPLAQTERAPAKPRQVKLGVKQRDKTTYLKITLADLIVTSATATDSSGTRSLKRIDKLAIPCADEQKECKTVELESGVLVGVCYCKDTQTALLLPAVQKIREAAARSQPNPPDTGHVKVFDGTTGAEIRSGDEKTTCWADEKLKLSICPQQALAPK